MQPIEYMSIEDAAKKWRTKSWYIARACDLGQVPGAAKLGESWIIPANMVRPEMHIPRDVPTQKKVEHGSDYKDTIFRMTETGFPDFNVVTMKIGNTTYNVYGSFAPTATKTLTEKLLDMTRHKYGKDLPPDVQKEVDRIKTKSREQIPTPEQQRVYYRAKFEEIGFSEDEIVIMMERIEKHIQTQSRKMESK